MQTIWTKLALNLHRLHSFYNCKPVGIDWYTIQQKMFKIEGGRCMSEGTTLNSLRCRPNAINVYFRELIMRIF